MSGTGLGQTGRRKHELICFEAQKVVIKQLEAIELVSVKIHLLALPGAGSVARALDEHPGAQDSAFARGLRKAPCWVVLSAP